MFFKVPLDLLKVYLPLFLDPKDLSELSGINHKYASFRSEKFVSPNYRRTPNKALYKACFIKRNVWSSIFF